MSKELVVILLGLLGLIVYFVAIPLAIVSIVAAFGVAIPFYIGLLITLVIILLTSVTAKAGK